jgi:hypothetical protein
MAVTRLTQTQYDLASAQHIQKGMGTIPAGAYLHEADVQGNVMLAYTGIALTTGNYPTYNLVAGIEYGAIGHVPPGITNGTGSGETWLSFTNALRPAFAINDNNGTSPTNAMERVSYGLDCHWRGLIYFALGADLYVEIGMDTAQPVASAFKSFFSTSLVYST